MNLLVADLVSDSVREDEAGVLVDVTAAVGLTHPSDLRQSKGATWFIHSGADVVPGGTSMASHSFPGKHVSKSGAGARIMKGGFKLGLYAKKGGGPALSSYKAYIVAQKGGQTP